MAILVTNFLVQLIRVFSEEREQLSKIITENKSQKLYRTQSQRIFDFLQEGIVLIENNSVSFSNNVFKNLLENFSGSTETIETIKLFKPRKGSESE